MALSKHQWEVREKEKAPKITIKEDLHDVIASFASSDLLAEAMENIRMLCNSLPPSSHPEPVGTLNFFAQQLQERKTTGFISSFMGMITLIEIVRLHDRYVIYICIFTLLLYNLSSLKQDKPKMKEKALIATINPSYNIDDRKFRLWMKHGTAFGCLASIGQYIYIYIYSLAL